MTPVVAAVQELVDLLHQHDPKLWPEASDFITAVLDNLDREAMEEAVRVAIFRYGDPSDIVRAALAAVRPCPAGGEEE